MKIVLSCLVLFVLGTPYSVHAQVYFKSEYATGSSFRDENNQKTGGSGDMFKSQGGFSLPLSYKKYDNGQVKAFAVSLDATYGVFNNKNIPADLHPDKILNTTLSLTYLTPISNKWSLLAVLGGGVYSDPSKITAKSILGSGGVVFVYHLLDNLDVGVGVGITNSYGVPMGLPMGYINWQLDGKYEVTVSMLENMEISGAMKMSNKVKIRLIGFELDGMSAVMDVDGKSKLFGTMSMKSGLQIRSASFSTFFSSSSGYHCLQFVCIKLRFKITNSFLISKYNDY